MMSKECWQTKRISEGVFHITQCIAGYYLLRIVFCPYFAILVPQYVAEVICNGVAIDVFTFQ